MCHFSASAYTANMMQTVCLLVKTKTFTFNEIKQNEKGNKEGFLSKIQLHKILSWSIPSCTAKL